MNATDRGALVGMVLGDGYINTSGTKSELSVLHSTTQREYCEHKAARVRQILGGAFSVREYANGPGGRYKAVKFTSSHKYWSNLKRRLYPNGVKTFTRFALDMLTDEGIAFWYMDDGSARRNVNKDGWVTSVATDIATMCSESECLTIVDYFKEVHDVSFKVRCRKGSPPNKAFYVQCNTAESRKFAQIVRPFIIPPMMYKIAHVADLDSHECRAPTGKCVKCDAVLYDSRKTGLCVTCYSRKYYRNVARHRDGRTPRLPDLVGDEIVRPNGKSNR